MGVATGVIGGLMGGGRGGRGSGWGALGRYRHLNFKSALAVNLVRPTELDGLGGTNFGGRRGEVARD